jgi:hypothetical protein
VDVPARRGAAKHSVATVSVGPAGEIVSVDTTTKIPTIKMTDGSEQKGQFPTQPSDQ